MSKQKPINADINLEESEIAKQKEKQALLFGADALLPKPKEVDKEFEKYSIYGKEYTLKELKALVNMEPSEYFPMFPNSNPFFSLMYKLKGWNDKNPKDYTKPSIVGLYIKLYIYARFDKDILPTLLNRDNPIVIGYIKKYKLFQFLNEDGKILMEQYIQDAIKVMEISKDWYDFEKKYTSLYTLSIQLRMEI